MHANARLKPFSEACERNQAPILEKLHQIFEKPGKVLEIGSGTGQHAVYFAGHLPEHEWQCSDLPDRHPGIRAWLDEARLENARAPIVLDVLAGPWPATRFDNAFSANTSHIMSWQAVTAMFSGVGRVLNRAGLFALYGPFNYDGEFTSESNRRFDAALRSEDPSMGLRDMRDIERLAASSRLRPIADHAMPANNRLLVFERT